MKNKHYILYDLKAKGFTESIIKKLKIEPDELRANPRFKKSSPMKLYLAERIDRIMESDEYLELIEKSKKQKQSAKKAAETKEKKELERISKLKINIKKIDDRQLIKKAIKEYNSSYERTKKKSISDSIYSIRSICYNYIFLNLTQYEDLGSNRMDLYLEYQERINKAIIKTYPNLVKTIKDMKINGK